MVMLMVGWLVGWLVGWFIGWLVDWYFVDLYFVECLFNWLIGILLNAC